MRPALAAKGAVVEHCAACTVRAVGSAACTRARWPSRTRSTSPRLSVCGCRAGCGGGGRGENVRHAFVGGGGPMGFVSISLSVGPFKSANLFLPPTTGKHLAAMTKRDRSGK